MLKPLTHAEVVRVLDHWQGQGVAVRVVSDDDDLIAVFQGELGPCSRAKQPALFWPLIGASHGAETPGLYLHHEVLQDAFVHTGGRVIELRQRGVTLNIRRL